jgi:hypothetical protein
VKVVVLPLTLSVELLPAGRWALTPSFPRQEPRGPTLPAAPSSATFFTGPERLAISGALDAARLRDALPNAIGDLCNPAIHEHSPRSPETLCAPTIHHLAVALSSWVFTLSDHRRVRSGWRAAPCGVTPVELPRNRTRSARAAQVPPIHVSPRGITLDVHYPDPLGSDTFCRELVELPAGEADTSGRLRAVSELTLDFAVYRRPAFARSAAA